MQVYLILLCLESLVLKHPGYLTLVASFGKKNSEGICCHILELTKFLFFCLGFLVTKFWSKLICLGKQRKMGKQEQPSKKKNMRCNRGKF